MRFGVFVRHWERVGYERITNCCKRDYREDQKKKSNEGTLEDWELILFPRGSWRFWLREKVQLWKTLSEYPVDTWKWSLPDHSVSLRQEPLIPIPCLNSVVSQLDVWEHFATYALRYPLAEQQNDRHPCNRVFLCFFPVWTSEEEWAMELPRWALFP